MTLLPSLLLAFALGFLGSERPDLGIIYEMDLLNKVLKEKGLGPVGQ